MGDSVVYETVAVHDFSEYVQGCVNVLDEEWSRSASSRSSSANIGICKAKIFTVGHTVSVGYTQRRF